MRTFITCLIFICISGCATTTTVETNSRAPSSTRSDAVGQSPAHLGVRTGERIAQHAMSMVGTPYLYGGSSPATGFDCSGLVYYSYTQSGISIPRTSLAQFRAARKISLNDAAAGDLLFFEDQEKLSHVGVYLGAQRFVHAPTSGRTVSVASLDDDYYQMHLVGVGRLLP